MADDNCAFTIRSARDLLEQQRAQSPRSNKWKADPPDPYGLPARRQRDFMSDMELETGM